jgi:uncharacterized membrane protein YdbT with pleckstrin-like domain
MSYIKNNLMPGEVLAFSSQQSIYLFANKLVLTAAFLAAFVVFRDNWVASAILVAMSFGFLFYISWNMHANEFAITDQRVIVKKGVINTKSIELNFNAIESVEVSQRYSEKILNIGNITITGNGGQREEIKGVEDPHKFKEIFLVERHKYIKKQNGTTR